MKQTKSKNVAVAAVLLTVLGLLAVPEADVLAWTHTGASWPGASTTYLLNPNFTDPSAGSTTDQVMAMRSGADEWRLSGQGNFEFTYGGTTSMTTVAADGTNTAFYNPIDGGGALAVCWYWFVGSDLTNFDIEFYDRDGAFDIVWATNPTVSQFDIEGVACHEFGHALGMGHSAVAAATMFPTVNAGSTAIRSLDADDIAGYQALYGTSGPTTPVVSTVTPDSGWIDGGYQVTVDGAYFPSTGLDVKFGGVSATNVTRVSSTRLTCTVPASTVPNDVDLTVTAQGETGTLTDGFDFLSTRYVGGPPALGAWHPMEVKVPAAPNTVFQGLLSFGTDGIPVNLWGDPGDTRVVPISQDWLAEWCVFYSGLNMSHDIVGITDGSGVHNWEFYVADLPVCEGLTFYACFILGDTGSSPSGISWIGNAAAVTMP